MERDIQNNLADQIVALGDVVSVDYRDDIEKLRVLSENDRYFTRNIVSWDNEVVNGDEIVDLEDQPEDEDRNVFAVAENTELGKGLLGKKIGDVVEYSGVGEKLSVRVVDLKKNF